MHPEGWSMSFWRLTCYRPFGNALQPCERGDVVCWCIANFICWHFSRLLLKLYAELLQIQSKTCWRCVLLPISSIHTQTQLDNLTSSSEETEMENLTLCRLNVRTCKKPGSHRKESERSILENHWPSSWNRIYLEKLIVIKPVKKFFAFCGMQEFVTVFSRAHHWSVSWRKTELVLVRSQILGSASICILSRELGWHWYHIWLDAVKFRSWHRKHCPSSHLMIEEWGLVSFYSRAYCCSLAAV
jgi:hypothetical protein